MATTKHGFPYPVGTDRVMDGDDAIKALAEALDTTIFAKWVQAATVPAITGAAAVTFVTTYVYPEALAAPPLAIIVTSSGNGGVVWSAYSATASQCTLRAEWADGGNHSNSGSAWIVIVGQRAPA